MKYAETCWTYGARFCKSNVMSNGHLSCMFILVHRIAYKKILQFSELQDFSLSFIRLGWSWRDLNPILQICLFQIVGYNRISFETIW